MLYVTFDITKYNDLFNIFKETHKNIDFIDLSKNPLMSLADEADSITSHHKECSIFLGYLEPGWMLEPAHQTRLRKLFRKFPVGLVLQFPESLPFSWKNEIDIVYTFKPLNKDGEASIIDNGGALHNKLEV
jgi:hypothetical protein